MYKSKIELPITENVGNRIMSLPVHPNLKNNDVTKIISLVNKFI